MNTFKSSDGELHPFETSTSDSDFGALPWAPARLPVLVSPEPDELLSSWLVRLAWLNAEKLHTFKRRFWAHPGTPWTRHIDVRCPDDTLLSIATMTGYSVPEILQLQLRSYTGKLFERVPFKGGTSGILSFPHYGRQLKGFGLQYCPECLQEEPAYFRKIWRVSFITCCTKHKRFLLDACPSCNQPIAYHLADAGKTHLPNYLSTERCSCGFEWKNKYEQERSAPSEHFLDWQRRIEDALTEGWLEEKHLHSLSYFNGLHFLLNLLTSRGKLGNLHSTLSNTVGLLDLPPRSYISRHLFDHCRVGDRTYLLELLRNLIESYPDGFIELLKRAGIAYSYLDCYKNQDPIPYWLSQYLWLLKDYHHSPISKEEKLSASLYLEKHGLSTGENNINRWMGRWHVH